MIPFVNILDGIIIINTMTDIQEQCTNVMTLFEKNESEGMKMLFDVMNSYQKKYETKDEELFTQYFRKDTKYVFQVVQKKMANEDIFKEMENEFDENDETDRKDKEEYLNFISNIDYILQFIDTVDLKNPNDEFTYKCNSATEYLKQKNTDMASLNDEMKKMSNTLGNLSTLLDNLRG
jgi:hypothetical protein